MLTSLHQKAIIQRLRKAGLEVFAEYRFDPNRRWRADIAVPEHMLLIEVDGGVFSRGRHVRPTGFINDQEKTNKAAVLGWKVLRCHTGMAPPANVAEVIGQALMICGKPIVRSQSE